SAIRLVMAQRLVRRLDEATRQAYTPDEQTKANVQKVIESLPEGIDKPNVANLQLYKPGSSADNPYGYRGQVALREQFVMSDAMRGILQSSIKLTTQDIEDAAIVSGMTTML